MPVTIGGTGKAQLLSLRGLLSGMGKTWENTNSNRMQIMKGFVCLVRKILSQLQCWLYFNSGECSQIHLQTSQASLTAVNGFRGTWAGDRRTVESAGSHWSGMREGNDKERERQIWEEMLTQTTWWYGQRSPRERGRDWLESFVGFTLG